MLHPAGRVIATLFPLETWVGAEPGALVFTSKGGDLLHPYVVQRAWEAARKSAGVEHLRFHDLRHTGNTLAAATGASTKELMARMGHSSPQAALIYQHASEERDRVIAEALSEMASRAGAVPTRAGPDHTNGELGHVQVTPPPRSPPGGTPHAP